MTQTTAMKIKKTIYIDAPLLGAKIRRARKCDPRTLAVLCQEAGISNNYWFLIEEEKRETVPEETVRKIEKVLGCDFGLDFDEALWNATENK